MTNILAHAYSSPKRMTPGLEAMMGKDMALRFGDPHKPTYRTSQAALEKIAGNREEHARENYAAVLAILGQPMTSGDIAAAKDWSRDHANRTLNAMLDEGLVSVVTVKRTRIWSCADTVGVSREGEAG